MAKRILIAEDDDMSREMLVTFAALRNYDVVAVEDGIDLLNSVENNYFDAIITDLMMANLNGASANEIMKMTGNTTPVIALTAASHEEIKLIKDKFSKIYHKPCNYDELFDFIDNVTETAHHPDNN